MPKSKGPAITFDSNGCVLIHDRELAEAMRLHLKAGKDVTLRVTASPSGVAIIGPQPIPQPPLLRVGCLNTMCDCPVDPLEQVILPAARTKLQPALRRKSAAKRELADDRK